MQAGAGHKSLYAGLRAQYNLRIQATFIISIFSNIDFTVINFGVKINKFRLNFVRNYVYDVTLNKPEPAARRGRKAAVIKR